jgi:hypothetical protein
MPFKYILLCLIFTTIVFGNVYSQQRNLAALSMGKVKLELNSVADGSFQYAVSFKGKPIVKPSSLGFVINDSVNFAGNFQVLKIDSLAVDESWKPVWGEVSLIRNHYKQLSIRLQQKNAPGLILNIVFRVFEDGVGFRYEFPVQPGLKYFIVNSEKTAFNLPDDHKAFWIPGDYDSNEYLYSTSKLSEIDTWKIPMVSGGKNNENRPDKYAVQTPLMMKTADGLYINIHEAALVDYPALQLHVDGNAHSLTADLVPDAPGNKAYLRAPSHTPWRTIIVSDKATDILASKMILNLNEPSKIKDPSWIRPMKFIGVWWAMQINTNSWSYTDNKDSVSASGMLIPHGRHGANTENVKRHIDFASRHGIKGLLVEGWNTGWEAWYGHWNGKNFDFVTPYPDFDVKEIENYSKSKGVQMIMHHETSADAATYDQQMDTAFRFMNTYGYNAVKTGYVGRIIPRGEHHDGQWMVNHYLRSLQKAADHRVMVDIHEPVRPTGLHRTWPNFLASEAARGNEWNGFSDGNPPEHETILPFTRLMGGPMDYTPGIFKLRHFSKEAPTRQMHSTLAKQLALYVTMYSPLQMAADLPENYEANLDAFQFIKDVGVDWDDTKIIEAEPGDYVTIARKEKGTGNWFVGAITDENSRSSVIPLTFLDKDKKYMVTIYRDSDDADWKTNPEGYKIEKFIVASNAQIKLKLAKGGGAALSITQANAGQLKELKKYK